MSIQSKSLEETIAIIKQEEPFEPSFHLHLGSFNVDEPYEDKETYKSLKWVIENQNLKLKKVTWGDIVDLIKEGKFYGWNALQSQSFGYQYFLPHGYTVSPQNPEPGHIGMDFKNKNDEKHNYETF